MRGKKIDVPKMILGGSYVRLPDELLHFVLDPHPSDDTNVVTVYPRGSEDWPDDPRTDNETFMDLFEWVFEVDAEPFLVDLDDPLPSARRLRGYIAGRTLSDDVLAGRLPLVVPLFADDFGRLYDEWVMDFEEPAMHYVSWDGQLMGVAINDPPPGEPYGEKARIKRRKKKKKR